MSLRKNTASIPDWIFDVDEVDDAPAANEQAGDINFYILLRIKIHSFFLLNI